MKRTLLPLLFFASVTAHAGVRNVTNVARDGSTVHSHSRGRWIAVRTITDDRPELLGAVIYYGTFPNAVKAGAFCRALIAGPGEVQVRARSTRAADRSEGEAVSNLTEIQFALLSKLAVGDKIRRRYDNFAGFYFEAISPAGAELDDVTHGLGGKRRLTLNTLDGLVRKGYLDYSDDAWGAWTRTTKEVDSTRAVRK